MHHVYAWTTRDEIAFLTYMADNKFRRDTNGIEYMQTVDDRIAKLEVWLKAVHKRRYGPGMNKEACKKHAKILLGNLRAESARL